MLKKLSFLVILAFSLPVKAHASQKLAQTAKTWASYMAARFTPSVASWRKNFTQGYKAAQPTYFTAQASRSMPYSAVAKGTAVAMALPMMASQPSIEFNVDNINAYPHMRDNFAAFAGNYIAKLKDMNHVSNDIVKSIVHFINRYPDTVPALVEKAQSQGQAVPTDIQLALAQYDATFKCNVKPPTLSASGIAPQIIGTALYMGGIEALLVVPKLVETDEKIIDSGIIEYSPEYYHRWKIAGKEIQKQCAKNIAQGVAVGVCQSVATELINDKINDRQVSSLMVKTATPLLRNAYNNRFTFRQNTQDVLAVGVSEVIHSVGKKTAQYLPNPQYNEKSYNNLGYYATHGAYWMANTWPIQYAKDVAVLVGSQILAAQVCDKVFQSTTPQKLTTPLGSIEM